MKHIESQMLNTFSRFSPSWRPVEQAEKFMELLETRQRIFVNRLHLLPMTFSNKRLLDLGCGTGEHTAYYATLGALVTGVDFNPVALERMREVFSNYGLEENIEELIETPVSAWKPKKSLYDICTADGVLHHLDNPREGFSKLCSALKPGGVLVIAVTTDVGSCQRDIMKRAILKFSDGIEDAVTLAHDLFPVYMNRAVHLGGRDAYQVVNDNFFSEQDVCLPVSTIIKWFREEKLKLYRSWPVLEPSFADSASSPVIDWTDPKYEDYLVNRSKTWEYAMESTETLVEAGKNECDILSIQKDWESEKKQLEEVLLEGKLEKLKALISKCKIFGKGFCGTGQSYYVGIKNSSLFPQILPDAIEKLTDQK